MPNGIIPVTGFEDIGDFGQGRTNPPGESEHGVRIPQQPDTGFFQNALQNVISFFSPVGNVIPEGKEISKGDILRLTFSMNVPFFKESQRDAVVRAINSDGRFNVLSAKIVEDRLIFDVEVIKSPFPLALLVGLIVSAGALVFLFLNFEKAEKLTKAATPLVFGIVAVIALLLLGRIFPR